MFYGTALSDCNKLAIQLSFSAQIPEVWYYNWSAVASGCPWPPPPPPPPSPPPLPLQPDTPPPPQLRPVNQRPWFWGVVGAIVASACLASGLAIALHLRRRVAARARLSSIRVELLGEHQHLG